MLYDEINTEADLIHFVNKLNGLSHLEQYRLFGYVFQSRCYELRAKGFPVTKTTHFQQWYFMVGEFFVFATMKINLYNFTENPEMKTGAYEKFYFNLNPNDFQGISQNIL